MQNVSYVVKRSNLLSFIKKLVYNLRCYTNGKAQWFYVVSNVCFFNEEKSWQFIILERF
jgi:hypothetical protein